MGILLMYGSVFSFPKKGLLNTATDWPVWLFITRVRFFSVNLKVRHLVIPTFAHAQTFDRGVYV